MEETIILNFFNSFFARNSDPNRFFRRDDEFCNLPWSEGLRNPRLADTLRNLQKTPCTTLYARTILRKVFDDDFIEAAIKTSNSLSEESEDIFINLDLAKDSLRLIPILSKEDEICMRNLIAVASAAHRSQKGSEKLLEITKGKYSRVNLYRIMKTASSTLEHSLRIGLLGEAPYYSCHKSFRNESELHQFLGRVGQGDIVECSWNPLAFATQSFNFAHSHFPVHEFHTYPATTYTVISIRDPIDRICSFFNRSQQYPQSSNCRFSSIDDFVENCHPDWIFGQLYFCDQTHNLTNAKKVLERMSRVLIVENSHAWNDILTSDLKVMIKTKYIKKGKYESRNDLKTRIESRIQKDNELSSRLTDEYELYKFAQKLSQKQ